MSITTSARSLRAATSKRVPARCPRAACRPSAAGADAAPPRNAAPTHRRTRRGTAVAPGCPASARSSNTASRSWKNSPPLHVDDDGEPVLRLAPDHRDKPAKQLRGQIVDHVPAQDRPGSPAARVRPAPDMPVRIITSGATSGASKSGLGMPEGYVTGSGLIRHASRMPSVAAQTRVNRAGGGLSDSRNPARFAPPRPP